MEGKKERAFGFGMEKLMIKLHIQGA